MLLAIVKLATLVFALLVYQSSAVGGASSSSAPPCKKTRINLPEGVSLFDADLVHDLVQQPLDNQVQDEMSDQMFGGDEEVAVVVGDHMALSHIKVKP